MECMANTTATVIPPAEAKVFWRTLRKQGLQDRVMQSRFLVFKNEGQSTAEKPLDTNLVLFGHPAPPGVQLGSLLLILKGVLGLNDAPRKWEEKISRVLVQVGFIMQRMCLGLFTFTLLLHVCWVASFVSMSSTCWELAMICSI